MARGVDLDPGATTASRSPQRASSSASTAPNAVDGFTGCPSLAGRKRLLLLSATAGPGQRQAALMSGHREPRGPRSDPS
jgi:hypothetical protein